MLAYHTRCKRGKHSGFRLLAYFVLLSGQAILFVISGQLYSAAKFCVSRSFPLTIININFVHTYIRMNPDYAVHLWVDSAQSLPKEQHIIVNLFPTLNQKLKDLRISRISYWCMFKLFNIIFNIKDLPRCTWPNKKINSNLIISCVHDSI